MKRKTLIANRDFKGKDGKDYRKGDRIEVDDDYGQELIQRGEAKEDPSAQQQPADKK